MPVSRAQRKSFLQLAIWASCGLHVLAQEAFQLAKQSSNL